MSLRNKLAAGVFAVSAFAAAGFAQDAKTGAKEVTKDGSAKIERRAGRPGDRGMHGLFGGQRGGMGRLGLFGIDLTDEQKAQIHQILEANRPDPAVMLEAKTILRAKFEGTATPEQEARLQVLKTQAMSKAHDVKTQLLAVLTPEQRAQIEQRKQEMKAKMQEFHQKMMDRHQLPQKAAPKTTPTDKTKDN